MPLPHKLRLFTLRHKTSLIQWFLVIATLLVLIGTAYLLTWCIIEGTRLYQERNQLKADADAVRMASYQDDWKRREREAYIAEVCRKDPLACKIMRTEWRKR